MKQITEALLLLAEMRKETNALRQDEGNTRRLADAALYGAASMAESLINDTLATIEDIRKEQIQELVDGGQDEEKAREAVDREVRMFNTVVLLQARIILASVKGTAEA